jgi:hypothetical protein
MRRKNFLKLRWAISEIDLASKINPAQGCERDCQILGSIYVQKEDLIGNGNSLA